jgi:hypothetical protein
MPAAYRLELGEVEQVTLMEMSKHHPKAYMRERAAAVLKVANGLSIRQVAEVGCLKRREWETVAKWVKAYEQQGLRGLYIRAGRGRKRRICARGDSGSPRGHVGLIEPSTEPVWGDTNAMAIGRFVPTDDWGWRAGV